MQLVVEMQAEQTSFVFIFFTSSMKLWLDVSFYVLKSFSNQKVFFTAKLIYIYSYNCPCLVQFVSLYI